MRFDAHSMFAALAGGFAESIFRGALALKARYSGAGFYKRLRRTLLVVACIASTVAYSAGSTQDPQPQQPQAGVQSSYPFSPEQMTARLSNSVMTELNRLRSNSSLRSFGDAVTAFFVVALLIWTSVKTMAAGKGVGELVAEWVPIFVGFGIVFLFLDRTAGELIERTMDVVGSAVAGTGTSSLDSALRAGMLPIFKAIASVVDMPRVTANTESSGSWFSATGALVTYLAGFGSWIMAAIAKVLTAFFLVLAGVVMAAHIIMGYVSVSLVLALAPVMVPFLLFRPLSWLFDSWLKFLLGACMLKIVAIFLLNVAAGLLGSVTELAAFAAAEARSATAVQTMFVDVLLYGILIAFAVLSALLMAQAPGISSGLMSGGTGSIGFSGIKAVSQSTMGRGSPSAKWGGQQAGALAQAPFAGARGLYQGMKGSGPDQVRRRSVAAAAYSAGRGVGAGARWAAKKL